MISPIQQQQLAGPIELEPNRWEVGLVEISYPYRKKQLLHNIIRLDAIDIRFPVKHYKSLYELFVTLKRYFKSAGEKDNFVTKFNEYLNKHAPSDGHTTNILGVCYGQNSLKVGENIISHFPVRVYNGLEDLAATIMAPANCSSSKVSLPDTDNSDFASPETVYVYTDTIKPNFVGDSYVRLLTPLHFPSSSGHHRFQFPLYRPVEQTFIESIAIRLVTKSGEDVAFYESDIPSVITLHFKNKSLA